MNLDTQWPKKGFKHLSKLKSNIIFYCLIIISIYVNLLQFYSKIESPLQSITDLAEPHINALINCFLFSLPFFFLKSKRSLYFVFLFLIDIILILNTAYFRYYGSVIPISSYFLVGNFGELSSNIFTYLQVSDFIYLISTIFLFLLYQFIFKNHIIYLSVRNRIFVISSLCLLSSGLIYADIVQNETNGTPLSLQFEYRDYLQTPFISNFGPIPFWTYQTICVLDNPAISQKEENEIKAYLSKNRHVNKSNSIHPKVANKNLILIIVESLDTWVTKYNDGEATPFLTKLSKSNNVVFVPNVLPQVNHSRSADAQLMFNTGLLPPLNNAVTNLYANQYYPSLAEALKKENNYSSVNSIGNEAKFWNQKTMNIAYHFDQLYSIENLKSDELFGMGLSDNTLFKQMVAKFKQEIKPPFYSQIVTLSSHDYIDFDETPTNLKFPSNYPTDVKNYIKAFEYTDHAIKLFFDNLTASGLMENSIVVIIGDHDGLSTNDVRPFLPALVDPLEKNRTLIPLYIVNSGLSYHQQKGEVIGEIDLYPSLLDLMQVKQYAWWGLGESIFSKHPPTFAVDKQLQICGATANYSKTEVQHKIDAWKISDIIIRKKILKKV
jgi:lipoteichoic acid synthase